MVKYRLDVLKLMICRKFYVIVSFLSFCQSISPISRLMAFIIHLYSGWHCHWYQYISTDGGNLQVSKQIYTSVIQGDLDTGRRCHPSLFRLQDVIHPYSYSKMSSKMSFNLIQIPSDCLHHIPNYQTWYSQGCSTNTFVINWLFYSFTH